MKWQYFLVLALGFLACESDAQTQEKKPEETKPPTEAGKKTGTLELETLENKVGYMLGLAFGKRLKNQPIEVNLEAVYQGIDDVLTETEPRIDTKEIRSLQTEMQRAAREKRKRENEEKSIKNEIEGEEFLANNKLEPGVVTLTSGLQYRILEEGTGKKPKPANKVEAHYRGTLLDGTEFDSSYKRNRPLVIAVRGVIKGWTEALQLMPVGSKWELYIPSELAYGKRGSPPKIGPNATLIFEIELLGIK
jgi:FKBP-type peptidyl-prolyl cis-trans isomerase FklB